MSLGFLYLKMHSFSETTKDGARIPWVNSSTFSHFVFEKVLVLTIISSSLSTGVAMGVLVSCWFEYRSFPTPFKTATNLMLVGMTLPLKKEVVKETVLPILMEWSFLLITLLKPSSFHGIGSPATQRSSFCVLFGCGSEYC